MVLTALSYAAENGYYQAASILLNWKPNTASKADPYGMTPLMYPIKDGHIRIVEMLLGHGVDADTQNKGDETPLSLTVKERHTKIVQILIFPQYNADINLKDNQERSPLATAAFYGHETTVRLLIARDDVDLISVDRENQTLFTIAKERGYSTILQLLSDTPGVDISWKMSKWA